LSLDILTLNFIIAAIFVYIFV